MNQIEQLIKVTDQQKGELIFLNALVTSIMQSMPAEFQAAVYQKFLVNSESVRSAALFSQASEDVMLAFEHYCSTLKTR